MKVYQLTWLTHCSSGTQTDFFKERDEYNLRKINYHIIQHVVNGLKVRMPLSKYKSQFVLKKNIRAIDKHGWNTTGINCTCVLMFTSFAYFQGIFSRKSIVLYARNDQTESCLKHEWLSIICTKQISSAISIIITKGTTGSQINNNYSIFTGRRCFMFVKILCPRNTQELIISISKR